MTFHAAHSQYRSAASSSSFSISTPSLTHDLHCTELQAALGLGLYAVGFGVVPLVTSSFSEVCCDHIFLFYCSCPSRNLVEGLYIYFHRSCSPSPRLWLHCENYTHGHPRYSEHLAHRAPNIGAVIAGRALGGIFGSTGASLVGGSIADIWKPQE